MGDALRSNADRLFRDVQMIHSRMVAELDRVDGGLPAGGRRARGAAGESSSQARSRPSPGSGRSLPTPPDDGDGLDVPEFIPPG
jgi:hypothetical protein